MNIADLDLTEAEKKDLREYQRQVARCTHDYHLQKLKGNYFLMCCECANTLELTPRNVEKYL